MTKNCLNLDSIMQNTTHSDSLYVKNSGCDTLKVSSITHHTNIFSVISSAFNVLPGDSVKLITTFAPVAAGNFTDTLNILNNNITQKVCLSGKAFPNPALSLKTISLM